MLLEAQYRILRRFCPPPPDYRQGSTHETSSRLASLLGPALLAKVAGKVVIDFGCGSGMDAIELARAGARKVIGIDIREDVLKKARENAQ